MSPKAGLWIIFTFSIAVLIAFITLDQIAPAGRRLIKIRGEDPVNYFGIAHSVLFDHDFNLNNEYERMPPDGRFWTANQPGTGLPGSPWGLGYSFLEIPLLALGTGVDALVGNPADGYSHWAIFFYCIGSLLMVGCGMAALFLLLRSVGEYWGIMSEDHQSAYALFVTLAIFFGTNVGYYAFSEMSHSSTFLFASLFLTIWWRVRESESRRDWLVLGLVGGFLSICRWQDVLYLGGPLLYDLFGGSWLKRSAWWRSRLLYGVGIGVCWIPQVLEWKAIYGKYVTIPQGGGIFSFPPAHMLQVLVSSQNGWFIWTPITILGVAGLFLGAVRATRIYLPWIIVLTLQAAVVGSVSFWSGVESFGARYMLSNTPLIGLGIITIFGISAVWVRRTVAVLCAVCCVFTSLFAVQFRLDLMPTETPLTFSELFTDKLRLTQVRQRRAAAKQAEQLLAKGDPNSAIRILEDAGRLGEDRNVDVSLVKAYRAAGRPEQADAAELRYKKLLESSLY
ncbi:MAG: hypothetical protein ABSG41_25335 [Bryobacteraceae bacterium]